MRRQIITEVAYLAHFTPPCKHYKKWCLVGWHVQPAKRSGYSTLITDAPRYGLDKFRQKPLEVKTEKMLAGVNQGAGEYRFKQGGYEFVASAMSREDAIAKLGALNSGETQA